MTSTPLPERMHHRGHSHDRSGAEGWALRSRGSRALVVILTVAAVNGMLVLWLAALGRDFGPAGSLQAFWNGGLGAKQNSQHFTDWYSLLHVIFGIGLFLAVDRLKPRWPTGFKFLAAICGSAAWEAIENTPFVIAIFTHAGTPGAYTGDSIVNSLGDMASVAIGFALAANLPLPATLTLGAALELAVSFAIHDGLVLGTLRLLGFPV